MILRLLTASFVAGTICSLAAADVRTTGSNPKTRLIPQRPAQRTSVEEQADQKKALQYALLKSAQPALGGFQQGSATQLPGTLALNGSDSCATPDVISGVGVFPFDNSAATTGTQGQSEALCLSFNHTAIAHDVWFVWNAPSSGTASVTLCSQTSIDSKIAAYHTSACPINGSAIACNDDNCNTQSSISFTVLAGQNYVLQVGTYYNASGGSGTFTISIVTSGPANDDCASAIPINGAGPYVFDTTGATTSTQQSGSCGTAGQDIWYEWTAPSSGSAQLDLCGTTFDTIVAAYAGAGCPGGGTIFCNDDSCTLQSQLSFPCTGGSVYMLQIGGYNGNAGPGAFSMNVVSGGPANDDCASATPISGAGPFVFDTSTASTSPQQSGTCGTIGQDLWYDWTAPSTGIATLALCNSIFDTIVAVYNGGGCPAGGTAWCNDDSCGAQSQVNFPCVAGNVYALQIGGYTVSSGAGVFTVNVNSAPANDSCSTPTAIAGNGTFPFDNTSATTGTEGQAETACLFFGLTTIDNDVWFAWTAPSSGTATFSLCGLGNMDSKIAVYAGSSCPVAGSALACNDDSCVYESELTFPCSSGLTYLLQIGNYAGATGAVGSFSVNVGTGGGPLYICDPGSGPTQACPCANPPVGSGRGCDNSSATGGASILGAGSESLATPTLAFTSAGEKPTATTVLLQGTSSNTTGVVFGQGIRCATGTLKRLYVKTASGGSITAPGAGDLDIPTRSANLGDPISAGQTRWYLAYYRDPIVLGGCSIFSTFNASNTAEVLWQP